MASIFMRFPGGLAKALTLSYDDGVEQDITLSQIMSKYGLKGTFNVNSGLYSPEGTVYEKGHIHRRMTEKQVTELFSNSENEVAVHALTHPFLEQLPSEMAAYEVLKDRKNLEKQFGRIMKGMAYPFGTYSDSVVQTLKQSGIAYARTTVSTEDFRMPTDWLRLTATCHHNNPKLKALTKKMVEETANRTPWLFYLWGHSYEFDSDKNWNVIEEFAERIGNKKDIWYATNIEIYNYCKAYSSLEFSVCGDIIHNPTAIELYLNANGQDISIAAGTTKRLK